jgi:hypothetical protein
MSEKCARAFTSLLVLLLAVVPTPGQYTTASLGGTVTDISRAAIPEARVEVRNVDTGLTFTTVTDSNGGYLFSRLPVGQYELTVGKEGFTTYVQTRVVRKRLANHRRTGAEVMLVPVDFAAQA